MDGPYTRYPRPTLWLLREGSLQMGGDGANTYPAFQAEVAPIYISKAPVTNEHYEVFRPDNVRLETSPGDDDPVVGVSWYDASAYCQWYSERTGKNFRLPTEIEWEYACRGDTKSRYFFGTTSESAEKFVWDLETGEGRTHAIERKRANPFGLYDMLGNVWEWTSSAFLPYPLEAADDQASTTTHPTRVLRGGSFRVHRDDMGCARRREAEASLQSDDIGFRIVRSF